MSSRNAFIISLFVSVAGHAGPAPKPASTVDEVLVNAFNDAGRTNTKGDHTAAVAKFKKLIAQMESKKFATVPRFVASVHMEYGYALMDVKDYAAAEAELRKVDVDALNQNQRYDYFFSLGNTLGQLKKLKPMFSAFVSAISAAEEDDDFDKRPLECWDSVLHYAFVSEDWKFALDVATKAQQVAKARDWASLQGKAEVVISDAKKHLKP